MQIESETLPRAQYVKRLEVEPPGAQPHRMRPITSLGGNPQALANPHDMSGISPNWQSQPQRNARFLEVHTARTSSTVTVAPRPIEIDATIEINTSVSGSKAPAGAPHSARTAALEKPSNVSHSAKSARSSVHDDSPTHAAFAAASRCAAHGPVALGYAAAAVKLLERKAVALQKPAGLSTSPLLTSPLMTSRVSPVMSSAVCSRTSRMTSVSAHRSEIVSFEHRPPQSRSSHAWRGQKKPRAKVAKIIVRLGRRFAVAAALDDP